MKILVYFGGMGHVGAGSGIKLAKRCHFRAKKETILEVILAPFRHLSGGIFECVFRRAPFLHFGWFWSPMVAKKGGFGRSFGGHSGGRVDM